MAFQPFSGTEALHNVSEKNPEYIPLVIFYERDYFPPFFFILHPACQRQRNILSTFHVA
jgi:hypothetical protein